MPQNEQSAGESKKDIRTMREYKRKQSALNVSRLNAYCGDHLKEGLDLATLVTRLQLPSEILQLHRFLTNLPILQ